MRLLADLHIAPRTVAFLRERGHDVIRVNEILPATADDSQLVAGEPGPSVVSLRLASSRIEHVNARLTDALGYEADLSHGALVTVEDDRIRIRSLPIG